MHAFISGWLCFLMTDAQTPGLPATLMCPSAPPQSSSDVKAEALSICLQSTLELRMDMVASQSSCASLTRWLEDFEGTHVRCDGPSIPWTCFASDHNFRCYLLQQSASRLSEQYLGGACSSIVKVADVLTHKGCDAAALSCFGPLPQLVSCLQLLRCIVCVFLLQRM